MLACVSLVNEQHLTCIDRSWELPLDNVYLDGAQLPQSTLSTGVSLSALIDTARN